MVQFSASLNFLHGVNPLLAHVALLIGTHDVGGGTQTTVVATVLSVEADWKRCWVVRRIAALKGIRRHSLDQVVVEKVKWWRWCGPEDNRARIDNVIAFGFVFSGVMVAI